MKLHENEELFQQAVQVTAERMGILDIYIEKDYWVCYALKLIFESAIRMLFASSHNFEEVRFNS